MEADDRDPAEVESLDLAVRLLDAAYDDGVYSDEKQATGRALLAIYSVLDDIRTELRRRK